MIKKNWTYQSVDKCYQIPFLDLLYSAQLTHRQHFNPNEIQLSSLINIKSGGCSEDCGYCLQNKHHKSQINEQQLLKLDKIIEAAQKAKNNGATRICMAAAWRCPPKEIFPKIIEIIAAIKELNLETCFSLGFLNEEQTEILKKAGLDFYNHNLDTSPEYYKKIITTHYFKDRLKTLQNVRKAGIKVCCGGIVGMGESRVDRINLLVELAKLSTPPESIPINRFVSAKGSSLTNTIRIDNFEFIRTIAITRIMFPSSFIRLSAGRRDMSDEMQTLCFLAGANSIFIGEKLLTVLNRKNGSDKCLLSKLGLQPIGD